jgi:large conductance mechanosensitive channel
LQSVCESVQDPYATLAEAQAAGAPTINYGVFVLTVLDFVIVAFVVFMLVRAVNRMQRPKPVTSTTKDCPYCLSSIPLEATRCPHCTSELSAA